MFCFEYENVFSDISPEIPVNSGAVLLILIHDKKSY